LTRDQPNKLSIRLLVRPGVTGWAQVNGGSTLTPDDKRILDEWYVRNASFALDIRILLRTLRILAQGGDLSTISPDARQVLLNARARSRAQNRLIFINRFYYPDQQASSQILTSLAVELARSGRDVHVITSRLDEANPQLQRPSVPETIDGVKVHRISLARRERSGLLLRLLDYVSFYRSLRQELNEFLASGDIIIAKSDPPLLSILAQPWAKRRGAALINWHQDLYPEVATQLGVLLLQGPLGHALISFRDRAIKDAVANVVVADRMAKRVISRGVAKTLVHIIPNWSPNRTIAPVAPSDNPLRKEWNLENKFVVGYSGNLGRTHEFRTILNAARRLKSDLRIVFLVAGSGRQFDKLSALVRVYGLSESFRLIPVQRAEMLACTLSAPDVHWVSLRPECEGLVFPSKIYGIAAAGRPIISICAQDGELAQLVRQYQCGLIVEPGDAHKLVSAILYLSWNPSLILAMGERARAMFEANYTWRHGVENWRKLIAEIEAINAERMRVEGIHAPSSSSASGLTQIAEAG
jgi:glycosyltransferase involved in cell wall biosynthesis